MDFDRIFSVLEKGMGVVKTLTNVKEDATTAIDVVKDLVTKAKDHKVTTSELDATEARLDALITDFNTPME